MRNAVRLVIFAAIATAVAACNGKPADQQAGKVQAEQKTAPKDVAAAQVLAISFLSGLQAGDKAKMYQATNLTTEQVAASRDKLVHIKQNKMTDAQRLACKHVLKISGDVDFFAAKLRKILTPTATIKITQTAPAGTPVSHLVHTVSVTYSSKTDAVQDKTGKAVKELKLPMQQFDHPVEAGEVHEFAFTGQEFEKMANRDFEVVSYF
ncbi:hypothetical protein KP005_03005 [Geomonas nitrogeniifigens]|uniref:Lipoprotein n=1 Tax=Geomonas diazotrophica TaxID=2843197 RepID=A0ABX8JJW1_9BACT|nr:hypothetical protein [Geomonas nitrogeniifigens]QWV98271.1 hypothetical protein KP005_03005 [Geomonas nitrogeniifigens]